MTMFDFEDLFASWELHPPQHVLLTLLAIRLGAFKPPESQTETAPTRITTLEELNAITALKGKPVLTFGKEGNSDG